MNIQEIFNVIKSDYQTILGTNLVGIYIHGSIAFGCFNEQKSDLDFIVVVQSTLDKNTKLALLQCLEKLHKDAPAKGFEMSVVLKKYCTQFQYPTPYELHFSKMWRELYMNNPMKLCSDDMKTDKDLAGHFMVTRHCGIVLCGEPIESVFGTVKPEYYIDSIVNDIKDAPSEIDNQPTYVILNLCRVLAYLTENRILSKKAGGDWAIRRMDQRWRPVIEIVLENYQSSSEQTKINSKENKAFSRYMLNRINDSLKARASQRGL